MPSINAIDKKYRPLEILMTLMLFILPFGMILYIFQEPIILYLDFWGLLD